MSVFPFLLIFSLVILRLKATTENTEECVDLRENCVELARRMDSEFCKIMSLFMHTFCRKTCGICEVGSSHGPIIGDSRSGGKRNALPGPGYVTTTVASFMIHEPSEPTEQTTVSESTTDNVVTTTLQTQLPTTSGALPAPLETLEIPTRDTASTGNMTSQTTSPPTSPDNTDNSTSHSTTQPALPDDFRETTSMLPNTSATSQSTTSSDTPPNSSDSNATSSPMVDFENPISLQNQSSNLTGNKTVVTLRATTSEPPLESLPSTPPALADIECRDLKENCEELKIMDYCFLHMWPMKQSCRKTCGFCDASNTSEPTEIPPPTSNGTITKHGCFDKRRRCTMFAARKGYCEKYKDFMSNNCAKACGFCSEEENVAGGPAVTSALPRPTRSSKPKMKTTRTIYAKGPGAPSLRWVIYPWSECVNASQKRVVHCYHIWSNMPFRVTIRACVRYISDMPAKEQDC